MRTWGSPVSCERKRLPGGWYPVRDRPAAPTVFRPLPQQSGEGWAAVVLRPRSHDEMHRERGLSTWPILIYSECAFN